MPLIASPSRAALSNNIAELRRSGRPPAQAAAIAYSNARKNGAHFRAAGGLVPSDDGGMPVHMAAGGLIASAVPGRTDRIPMRVRPNSYVIPSDVVSGVGQGNTLAGAEVFNKLLKQGPYGSAMPHMAHGSTMPQPKPPPLRRHFADGGEPDGADIIAAGGEYLVTPETVANLGGGDYAAGHAKLDDMVTSLRKQIIGHMKSLPGPRK